MKPSEIVRLFAKHPAYNPEGLCKDDAAIYHGTRYLCCVGDNLGAEDKLPSYRDLLRFRNEVGKKLESLNASVLSNHFRYNLGVRQTLENSREFWEEFAKELETKGL